MPLPDRIERVLDLHHPPDTVWAALTTSDGLSGWFGNSAEIDTLAPGGQIRMRWDEHGEHTLWIAVVDPPHRFAYRWAIEGLPATDPRRTYVEFTLAPLPTGTRLTVVETGFAQLPDELASAYEGNVEGWRMELAELVGYLDAA